MTRIAWGTPGTKLFEAGVDRGVLYTAGNDGVGVPWNGLITVNETPSGGTPTPYYADGVKYMNVPAREEFEGTIEAFMSPPEFDECDGTLEVYEGLFIHQQRRRPFDFTYRTGLGSDLKGLDHGYNIHLVYNALAGPSQRGYASLSDSPEAMTLSWDFTTTPILVPGQGGYPTAHIKIDSTRTEPQLVLEIEEFIYGNVGYAPKMPTIPELLNMYLNWHTPLEIEEALGTGLAGLVTNGLPDLNGNLNVGIYRRPRLSRLSDDENDGLYDLEN